MKPSCFKVEKSNFMKQSNVIYIQEMVGMKEELQDMLFNVATPKEQYEMLQLLPEDKRKKREEKMTTEQNQKIKKHISDKETKQKQQQLKDAESGSGSGSSTV